ncbi:MAG TPA: CoA pyrophosphatase [Desulfuromonadaceae bacterium]
MNFEGIAQLLGRRRYEKHDMDNRTRAAVAMMLRQGADDLEMLFIERAVHERDPWSGNLAFPGGKVEPGERARQAAERETLEEIGFDLQASCYMGRLADIAGANLPVRVSCFAFGVDWAGVEPVLSDEVGDLFWVKLNHLRSVEHRITAQVRFGDKKFVVPAIRLPQTEKTVLWGLTYRLVLQFLENITPRR